MSQPLSPPTNPIPGAIYTEDLTGIAWVWTGVSWIEAGGSGGYNTQVKTGMALTPGFYSALSSTTAGGSGGQNLAQIATQYGPTAPVNPAFGQTWVDTSDANRPVTYVWTDPGAWTKTSDGTNNMYVQVAAPTDHEIGDQWYNTSSNTLSVWDGVLWQAISGSGGSGIASQIQQVVTTPAVLDPGSIIYNSTEKKVYISDGVSWLELDQAPDVDTHSILAFNVAPTTRANGDALQAGDNWIDTGSNTFNYYDGASWVRVSSATVGDTHSFWQANAPTLRPDNTSLAVGDMWVDSDNASPYVWNGSVWTALINSVDNNTNSIVSLTPPSLRTTPSDTTLQLGDLWVNTGDYSINYWNGSSWIPLTAQVTSSSDKHSFFGTAAPTLTQRPDTSALLTGDQFVDTTTGILYYWTGGAWASINGGGTVASALPLTEGIVYGYTEPSDGLAFLGNGAGQAIQAAGIGAGNGYNVAVGHQALQNGTNAGDSIAIGYQALRQSDGTGNVAIGYQAGNTVTTGGNNIGIGFSAITGVTTGSGNVAVGYRGGFNWTGADSNNASLGGYWGVIGESNTVTLARGGSNNNLLFQINDSNAYGIPTTTSLNNTTVDFGTAGQVLTSQGPTANPIWTTVAAGGADYMGMLTEGSPGTRPDGSALQLGDQYQESSVFEKNAASYVWTTAGGGSWLSAHAVHEEGAGAPVQTTRTYGDPLIENDFYIDETNADLYRWDGAAWQLLTAAGTPDHQQAPVPASATQLAGFPTTRGDGVSALQTGDTFQSLISFNGGTYYRSYYYDGTQWMPNGTHNFVDDATPNVAETFAGDTWSQPSLGRFYFAYDTGSGPTWTQIV